MKVRGFAVYDRAAEAFHPPYFSPAIGLAVRSFQDACTDAQSAIAKHAEDYELFEVGVFDDELGVFEPLARPTRISTGREILSLREVAKRE